MNRPCWRSLAFWSGIIIVVILPAGLPAGSRPLPRRVFTPSRPPPLLPGLSPVPAPVLCSTQPSIPPASPDPTSSLSDVTCALCRCMGLRCRDLHGVVLWVLGLPRSGAVMVVALAFRGSASHPSPPLQTHAANLLLVLLLESMLYGVTWRKELPAAACCRLRWWKG